MLRGARIEADWIAAPTAEDIRANDRTRLLEALLEPAEFDDEDRALAAQVLEQRSPEDVAAALVRAHRQAMPQPEELIANNPERQKADREERHRPGFEDVVWFRMDIGRRQNADPRWILPLLCRRGHITRNEIGAIRIGPNETHFQIPRAIAERFDGAVRRTASAEDENDVTIEHAPEGPRQAARQNRKGNDAPRQGPNNGPRVRPVAQGGKKPWPKKPHRKGSRKAD
jgi:ATP-dependent RNA helicase DeaD